MATSYLPFCPVRPVGNSITLTCTMELSTLLQIEIQLSVSIQFYDSLGNFLNSHSPTMSATSCTSIQPLSTQLEEPYLHPWDWNDNIIIVNTVPPNSNEHTWLHVMTSSQLYHNHCIIINNHYIIVHYSVFSVALIISSRSCNHSWWSTTVWKNLPHNVATMLH